MKEEILEVTPWVVIRSQWFGNCFPLSIPLNMALQMSVHRVPLGVLQRQSSQNSKLNITFLELTLPAYCIPACYPLRVAWDVILFFSRLGISLAELRLHFFCGRIHIWRRFSKRGKKILNSISGKMQDSSNLEVFTSGGYKYVQMRGCK